MIHCFLSLFLFCLCALPITDMWSVDVIMLHHVIIYSTYTVTSCSFQFMCEEGSVDYIARVDEPQSCRYVLTVHTSRVCQHPFLKPPSNAKPHSIVCQPALSAQQYMDYVNAQVCTST